MRINGEGTTKNRREFTSELTLTSFIDILSLLIFFLIFNMAVNEIAAIQMQMGSDKAATAAIPEPVKEIQAELKITIAPNVVELSDRGRVTRVNYQAETDFDWTQVDTFLKTARSNYPQNKNMIIQSRDAVSYGMVVKALDYSLGEGFKELVVMGVE